MCYAPQTDPGLMHGRRVQIENCCDEAGPDGAQYVASGDSPMPLDSLRFHVGESLRDSKKLRLRRGISLRETDLRDKVKERQHA